MLAGRGADPGLRAYLLKVYNYMALGLLLTAGVGYYGAASGLIQSLAASHWFWVVVLAPLALVFALSFGIQKMSLAVAS
jgi:FtsH-binding integral membrane protein